MKDVSLVSNETDCVELFDKGEELLMGQLVLVDVGEIVEVAEVRMHQLHYHDWVQGQVNFECLGILIAELNESVQG